ncbi:hypothetical protein CFOL_v3_07143 [Cephalotus follicularis]|uniref:FBD domain-containing protein n=1 Tax=Cephalotus follicularis TaxID=3775 RepID=A0A1Q3B6U7_CEPFO|nr:hypothetical protein CFOL_v3_07143 [Cephalotus follicularis]
MEIRVDVYSNFGFPSASKCEQNHGHGNKFSFEFNDTFPNFPKLKNLWKLDLSFKVKYVTEASCIIALLSVLLEVSPSLHTLILEFPLLWYFDSKLWRTESGLKKVQKADGPHQCLEEFTISRFLGCEFDIGIGMDIIAIAVSLKKMIIDVRPPLERRGFYTGNDEERSAARARAMQFETVLPMGAQLVIL